MSAEQRLSVWFACYGFIFDSRAEEQPVISPLSTNIFDMADKDKRVIDIVYSMCYIIFNI